MSRTPHETFLSDQALARARGASNGVLLGRVLARGVAGPDGCIIWTGAVNNRGYGQIRTDGELAYVHRVAYDLLVGPLSEGMLLDHRCHNQDVECAGGNSCLHRRCINPHHLEPVTNRQNQLRSSRTLGGINIAKTHCLRGHSFDAVNTYVRRDNGGRQCRQCRRDRGRWALVQAKGGQS